MKTRILAAIPIAVILIAALIFQSWVLLALVVAMSVIAQTEILHAVEAKGTKANWVLPILFCAATPAVLYFWNVQALFVIFAVMLMILFITCMFSKKYDFTGFANTVLAMVYPQTLFVFIYLLIFEHMNMQWIGNNPFMLLMAILPPIFCDILAYFIGRAFGRKKLCPEISPKKTVAGAVGGVVGGVIAGFLVWLLFASGIIAILSFPASVIECLLLGALVAFISQFGDLSASFIKRHFGIKDYGKLIPGHGGILDRMDSILFAVPVVYLVYSIPVLFAL